MKSPADMTDKEIRNEIFSGEASAVRERALAEELCRRGALSRKSRSPEVNRDNEEV